MFKGGSSLPRWLSAFSPRKPDNVVQNSNQPSRGYDLHIRQLTAALDTMSQGLCMYGADSRLVVANARFKEMYAFSDELTTPGVTLREMVEGQVARGIYSGNDPEAYINDRLARATNREPEDELRTLADGRIIAISRRPTADGGWVTTHEDITERQRANEKIAHMARHDALTNLPNRICFREEVERALAQVRRRGKLAILSVDLDHFKNVNDALGHPIGDALLNTVADRLRGCIRENDIMARLGGDEFAILQVGIGSLEEAGSLAERVIEAVSAPYVIDAHEVVVGATIGIALAPGDAADADQLLQKADMALYRAKSEGRATYRYFAPVMDLRMKLRRALEMDLRQALAAKQFVLYYQPIVSLDTGGVIGCEALVRWHHPHRGLVSPAEFIPVAEEIGLIVPLGEWVLQQACAEAATWPSDIKVAVNLSPAQFKSSNLEQVVVDALTESGLSADRLELEITESVLLQDNETTHTTLHKLRKRGVRIAMDDFGTGYSSLSYLRSFPFDKIKIDASFVRDISKTEDAAAIVRAVAGLGTSLGMITTAEGVETEDQLAHVRTSGCTEGQGFYFSPPLHSTALVSVLCKQNAA